MEGLLITSSLLDSYAYLQETKNKISAYSDFVGMLKRESRPTNAVCQRGIDFENLVCENCNTDADMYAVGKNYYHDVASAEVVDCMASVCRGGSQQVKVETEMTVNGEKYHLFGKADIIHYDQKKILDIKTCTRYTGEWKYLKRSQHHVYYLCTGLSDFEYVVADYCGKKTPQKFVKIPVKMNWNESAKIIAKRINEVTEFIKRNNLWNDYVNTFTKEHKDRK